MEESQALRFIRGQGSQPARFERPDRKPSPEVEECRKLLRGPDIPVIPAELRRIADVLDRVPGMNEFDAMRTTASGCLHDAIRAGAFSGSRWLDFRIKLAVGPGITTAYFLILDNSEAWGVTIDKTKRSPRAEIELGCPLIAALLREQAPQNSLPAPAPKATTDDAAEAVRIIADRAATKPRLLWLKFYLDQNPNATLRDIETAAKLLHHSLPRASTNGILARETWIGHQPRRRSHRDTSIEPILHRIPSR